MVVTYQCGPCGQIGLRSIVTISRLFTDPALRKRLSQNAREFVEREYTWERAGEAYEQVLLSS